MAGQLLAPGHEDFHPQPQGLAGETPLPHLAEAAANHPPRHRVDGRLSHRQRQSRFGHPAHPFPPQENHLLFGALAVKAPDPGPDLGPVGDVGIVPGVLDHRGLAPLPGTAVVEERNSQAAPPGQGDFHPFGGWGFQQLPQGPLGRGCGRGAGGKALAQLFARPGWQAIVII